MVYNLVSHILVAHLYSLSTYRSGSVTIENWKQRFVICHNSNRTWRSQNIVAKTAHSKVDGHCFKIKLRVSSFCLVCCSGSESYWLCIGNPFSNTGSVAPRPVLWASVKMNVDSLRSKYRSKVSSFSSFNNIWKHCSCSCFHRKCAEPLITAHDTHGAGSFIGCSSITSS